MSEGPTSGDGRRLWQFTGLVGAAGLCTFAIVDVLELHVLRCAPLGCLSDWVTWLFLLCVPLASIYWFRRSPKDLRLQLTIVSAFTGPILAFALVVTFGFWFHVAIGGGI